MVAPRFPWFPDALAEVHRERNETSDANAAVATGKLAQMANGFVYDESPQPDPADLTKGVYASPEDLDTPHHK